MSSQAPIEIPLAEIARAARILWIRSRREAGGLLTGSYASAFRGGGVEFEESRPYVPGDDVRTIDWNASARTGELWVKRFREERLRTVLVALDVSASMRFGTTGTTKAAVAARAAALLAAAAGRAGDRIGLVAFADGLRAALPPGRGEAHSWRVIRSAVQAAGVSSGGTDLDAALEWIRQHADRRAVVLLVSDFRDGGLFEPSSAKAGRRGRLVALARRHDLVAAIVEDPGERAVPPVGAVRIVDPERPGRKAVLATGRSAPRTLYSVAASVRRRALEQRLRTDRIDLVWLSTAVDPLLTLTRFFGERTARVRTAS